MQSRFLQILIIFFLFQSQTKASHLMGGEVSYRHLGGLKYEVIVKLYRDCRGIPLNSPTCSMIGDGDSSKKKFLSLTLISIQDVTNHCKKLSNPCSPQNQTISGQEPALEEHLYKDTVDFNKADSVFRKYCRIQFGAGQCCRNAGYTMTCSNDFWVFCELNICMAPKNSSPVLKTVPENILCCYQPVNYNYGAVDTVDMDSLSYEWTDPMINWKKSVTWCWGGSTNSPFSDYWPSSYDKKKGPDPSANPPIGTYLNPETGDLIFTPIDCSGSNYSTIKISEWRKDSTGKYIKIGEVRRDIEYTIISCPDNNPPTLNGPFKYEVCANQKICFNVTSNDKQFVPKPPAKANPPDTVSLTWNNGIGKGATFTIANTKALLQSGQFCWTPKEADANDVPYTFTVTARDNNCPRNGIYVRTFSVKVKAKAKATLTKKLIKNGLFEIKAEPEKGFKGTPAYFLEIVDSTMTPVDTSVVFGFTQSGGLTSNRQIDSVQFNKSGKYFIHFRINNSPLNCPTDYFDTLNVGTITPFLKIQPTQLLEKWVCKSSTQAIAPILKNAKSPIKFRWSTSKTDTFQTLTIKITKDTILRVDVYDGAGYHRFATWKFNVYKEPVIKMGKDILSCKGDSVLLAATVSNFSDTINWKWIFEGKPISTSPKIKVVNPGLYSLEVSTNNSCVVKSDTMEVRNVMVNADAGIDRKVCKWDTVMLKAGGLDTTNGKSGKYYWYKGSFNSPKTDSISSIQYPFRNDSLMVLQLIQTENLITCYDLDTVAVSFRPLPEVVLGHGTICQSEKELDLNTLIIKPANPQQGIISWDLAKTLKKPDGKDNLVADLIYDKDTTSGYHYYLKVDDSNIDLKTKFIDSLKLILTYKDAFGCVNSSSNYATVVIRKNLEIKFTNDELQRCYADSVKYISNDYGVNYYGGTWFTNNDSSNYAQWPQGNTVQLSEKLGTRSLNPKGGKYLMRYELENNKCYSSKNAVLIINPYPVITWSQTDKGDSIVLTENSNAEKREWYLNKNKMSVSYTFTVSKIDALSFVILLKTFNANCETDSIIKPNVQIGINDPDALQFSISPNPVKKDLLIKTTVNQSYEIEIVNSLGQMVLKKSSVNKEETIDVSEFANGIYSILVKTGNDIFVQKFVKTSE